MRLTALTEAGRRGPWSSAADINLFGGPNPTVPRDAWTITTDSAAAGNEAEKAIDGDLASMWHTRFTGTLPYPPHPHTFTITLDSLQTVTSLSYLPRPAPNKNGNIGTYRCAIAAAAAAAAYFVL